MIMLLRVVAGGARSVRDAEAGGLCGACASNQEATMKCRKCSRPVHMCQACDGGRKRGAFGALTCKNCNTTGYVCGEHGGYWK
jgi:hypothetical protein